MVYDELLELRQAPDESLAALATRLADHYEFPVDYVLLGPDGNVVAKLNANGDLLPLAEDERERTFLRFLERGLSL